jgi:hypothetical protein
MLPPLPAAGSPVAASETWLAWPTAGLPVVLPWTTMPPAVGADLAAREGLLPLPRRVALLLAADRRAQAWALAIREPRPLAAQGRLEIELAVWAAAEAGRLGLPAGRGPVLVVGESQESLGAIRGALNDVQDLLALPWPRWAGPVVVFIGGPERGIPPTGVVRPALPLFQIPPGGDPRPVMAAHLAQLALDLTAPPPGGWPEWLRQGIAEVARAKAAGEGPSPRRMRDRRTTAGVAAIRALFAAPEPDPALAGAVVAPLVTKFNQDRWIAFLDLLRQRAGAEGALQMAFAVPLESL